MPLGTVKWYDDVRRFGFIVPAGSKRREDEVFVHASALKTAQIETLSEGWTVEYDLVPGKRGEQAGNLRVVGR